MIVWKFPVRAIHNFTLTMPRGAQVLSVQVQRDVPQMWALCDPGAPLEERTFFLSGTGGPVNIPDEDLHYVGTFQIDNGNFVGHVFEFRKEK